MNGKREGKHGHRNGAMLWNGDWIRLDMGETGAMWDD